jgi:hypothetical protein
MRKVVYLRHALTDFGSKTNFGNVIKFHWDHFHKNFSFSIKFIIKAGLEVDKWWKMTHPGLMFNYANVIISTFLHPNGLFLERIWVNRLFFVEKEILLAKLDPMTRRVYLPPPSKPCFGPSLHFLYERYPKIFFWNSVRTNLLF